MSSIAACWQLAVLAGAFANRLRFRQGLAESQLQSLWSGGDNYSSLIAVEALDLALELTNLDRVAFAEVVDVS